MLRFHHIGYASKNIKQDLRYFKNLGYQQTGELFIDENQKIRGVFLISNNAPRIELVENLGEFGPLNSLLDRGIKFYHFAYAVDDLNKALEYFCKECAGKNSNC